MAIQQELLFLGSATEWISSQTGVDFIMDNSTAAGSKPFTAYEKVIYTHKHTMDEHPCGDREITLSIHIN